jgi:hypothetical protein|tara:strand:+ start:375 stop:758 length:384 start_codon:yes stop_codon:yes gene_type:complete
MHGARSIGHVDDFVFHPFFRCEPPKSQQRMLRHFTFHRGILLTGRASYLPATLHRASRFRFRYRRHVIAMNASVAMPTAALASRAGGITGFAAKSVRRASASKACAPVRARTVVKATAGAEVRSLYL